MPAPLVIDISHHQANVDFARIRAAGILGVIHKSSEGTSFRDKRYHERKRAAIDAGLLWGAYHFATNAAPAAQVDHFMAAAEWEPNMLMALDLEDYGAKSMTLAQARDFMELLERRIGMKAVLYSGNTIKEMLGKREDAFWGARRLWIPQYGPQAKVQASWRQSGWWLWQFSDKGRIDGVDGPVDVNAYARDETALRLEWARGTMAAEPGPARPTPPVQAPAPTRPSQPVATGGQIRLWPFIAGAILAIGGAFAWWQFGG